MDNMMSSSELERKMEKIKVSKIEMVVHGTVNKPYFELEYTTMDGNVHVGYSSYDIVNVFGWKDQCFDLVGSIK